MEKVYMVKARYGSGSMVFESMGDAMEATAALVDDKHPEDYINEVPIVRKYGGVLDMAGIALGELLGGCDDGGDPVRDDE